MLESKLDNYKDLIPMEGKHGAYWKHRDAERFVLWIHNIDSIRVCKDDGETNSIIFVADLESTEELELLVKLILREELC